MAQKTKGSNVRNTADEDRALPIDRKSGVGAGRQEDEPIPAPEVPPGNAAGDEQKMKANRERLHVDEEHKTPEMEKKHRGTFP